MLCQDCEKIDTCTELCERAEKYVDRGFKKSTRELLVGGEVKYDNSSIWPDDPDMLKDPDVLLLQIRQTGKAGIDRMRYQSQHQAEDDHEHTTGPGLRGKHVQAPTLVPYSEMASYWKAESAELKSLTDLQHKILHYLCFEGLSHAEIAQRTRLSKDAVRGQIDRAKIKSYDLYSKYEKGEILYNFETGKPILDKEKAHRDYPYDPEKH